jgi:hypothetical protein
MKHLTVLLLLTLFVGQKSFGQETDTIPNTQEKKEYRNTFKWNLTPQLLWGGKNLVFGIERKLSSHRSFSINAGHLSFPSMINEESKLLNVVSTEKNTGFSFAFDYRFYAKKRNKNEAPDGLYWAPFFVSYNYKIQNKLDLLKDDNTIEAASRLDTQINAFNMGVEVGYQFVFKKRFAFDMILIGPAIGYYRAKFDLDVTVQSENEYLQAIKDALANRIPLLGDLLEDNSVTANGNLSAFKPGFRYVLQIGYRF